MLHILELIIEYIINSSSCKNKINCYGSFTKFKKDDILKILLYLAMKNNIDNILLIDME